MQKNCSNLLKLNIQDCDSISQDCIIEITKLSKKFNSFFFGNYYSQFNINNEHLITISNNCKNLKSLDIYNSNFTDLVFDETLLKLSIFNF